MFNRSMAKNMWLLLQKDPRVCPIRRRTGPAGCRREQFHLAMRTMPFSEAQLQIRKVMEDAHRFIAGWIHHIVKSPGPNTFQI